MKVKATVATIAASIAMVKDVVKKGEKVFNAYMMLSPFVLIVGCVLARPFSLSLLFCFQSQRMGGFASSRYGCTISAKNNDVNFFFKFFFSVECGGIGCWVYG